MTICLVSYGLKSFNKAKVLYKFNLHIKKKLGFVPAKMMFQHFVFSFVWSFPAIISYFNALSHYHKTNVPYITKYKNINIILSKKNKN
jgi:hypothetical protein